MATYLDPPIITVYARKLDAVTLASVTDYELLTPASYASSQHPASGTLMVSPATQMGASFFDYGILNGVTGGSSQYIIEFDIWNNEPAISSGGFAITPVCDATNVSLFAQDTNTTQSIINLAPQINPNQPGQIVLYGRCTTMDINALFYPFAGITTFNNIVGNVDPSAVGILHGNAPGGDHAVIQTKITLQPNTPPQTYLFAFGISYDYAPQTIE